MAGDNVTTLTIDRTIKTDKMSVVSAAISNKLIYDKSSEDDGKIILTETQTVDPYYKETDKQALILYFTEDSRSLVGLDAGQLLGK